MRFKLLKTAAVVLVSLTVLLLVAAFVCGVVGIVTESKVAQNLAWLCGVSAFAPGFAGSISAVTFFEELPREERKRQEQEDQQRKDAEEQVRLLEREAEATERLLRAQGRATTETFANPSSWGGLR